MFYFKSDGETVEESVGYCISPVGVPEGGFWGKLGKILFSFPNYYMFNSQVTMDTSSSILHVESSLKLHLF